MGGGHTYRLVVVVGVVAVLASVTASGWLWGNEQRRAADTLGAHSEALVDSTAEAVGDAVERLVAVGGFFRSSDQVTRVEFRRFVTDIGLQPGLGGIGYTPIVRVEDLDGFVDEMRGTIPDYAVFALDAEGGRIPVGERTEYAPVQWFEPFDAFGQPHGFDSFSEVSRLAALEWARATGEVAATPFVRLVSETESDGFLLYWPVTDPDTAAVVGFTVAPMDLSELLDGHLPEALSSLVDWKVADITTDPSPQVQVSADGGRVGILEVGNRRWEITVTPKPSSNMLPDPTGSLLVLFVGLVASALAAGGFFLYRQRLQARQELEVLQELTRARDQFLASVSHELRTPLTGVLGFAELLREGHGQLSDEERLSMISSVADEATDLSHIIDDLLVSARSELDLLVVTRVPVSARAQVAQVLEAAGSDTRTRVEVIDDPNGACKSSGDPGRIRQILRNLISNAYRYGGDRIQVRLSSIDQLVHIQVADNGPGLPAEEWERIFEPYYRAHPQGSQPAALGIGLSVARHLARLMDGDLTYRRQDHWSVFDLELPTASSPTAERAPPQTAKVNSR